MAQLTNVEDVYPLTGTQLGMLYHTLDQPASGVYTCQLIMELSGDLDLASFQDAWDEVTSRHAALRTAYVWDALDEPVQVVRETVEAGWVEHDLSHLSDGERSAAVDSMLAEDRMRGFDLAAAPLIRMNLIRTGPNSRLWVLTSHHLNYDGWSTQIILDELFLLYRARVEGKPADLPPPFKFRDFVDFQANASGVESDRFWQASLQGFSDPHYLEVPGLPPEPGAAGHRATAIPLPDFDALQRTASQLGVTLNTVLAGAWSLVLSRWARTNDVVFGTTVAGRPMELDGIDRAVGLFITTLPARVQVTPNQRLADFLRAVQADLFAAQDHQHLPLSAIQRLSDVGPGRSLFESVLVLGNYPARTERSGGEVLSIGRTRFIEASNYPLAVLIELGDQPEIILVHDVGRFSSEAVESIGRQLVQVLAGFVSDPHAHLSRFSVTPEIDGTIHEGGTLELSEAPIHGLISVVTPDHPAVVFGEQAITYAELEEMSDRLARQLIDAGAKNNQLVGLYLPRSIEMIVGMVGILKAGCAYVPLDPTYPGEHIRSLLDRDEIGFVVSSSGLISEMSEMVTWIDIHSPDPPAASELPSVSPDQLAYVIHTSGSTGQPKGVMVTHGNLVASNLARHAYYGDPVGSFLLLSSFAFDSSVAGIFWTLTTGGTLVLPSPGLEHDADALVSLIEGRRITHTLCLPSVYGVLLDSAKDHQLESLDVVVVAGEACPPGLTTTHFARLGSTALYNEYGPTEGTVWCTVHRACEDDEVLPIGKPIAGARIHVLDEYGKPVPSGFAGEICIAGPGVVPGYLGRPDLTAERFVTTRVLGAEERIYRTGDLGAWRSDGVLSYLGRSDSQLKIRGRRIEASAVETALRSHPAIREAIAVGRSAPERPATQLVAYVATDREDFDAEDVKRSLSASLPEFMVPDIVVPLAEIPRLPNGKVDTGSLPDPRDQSQRESTHIAPRTDRERVLAAIWSDLLGLEPISVRDDFFELGGDSIVSIQMISRARQAGIPITPAQITSHPTIEQLAMAADARSTLGDALSGPVPLSPIQNWFFAMDHAVPGHWNQSTLLAIDAEVDRSALEQALQACVQHHDMLRARFVHRDGTWEQLVDPDGAIALEIIGEAAEVEEIVDTCQRSLDLVAGPLFRAVLIVRPSTEPDLLFLAVHHLVIDVVSWAILIDDLGRAYLQASTGGEIELLPRSTSYRDWITYLASDERAVGMERDFWATGAGSPAGPPEVWGTEASRQTVTVELEADVTGLLLREANDAFRTRPDELIIAALAPVLGSRPGGIMRLALERHGRPADIPGIDLSRTVGWFTAQYPVTLTSADSDAARLISATKETLRSVPNGGLGYGVLRYLQRLPDLVQQAEPAFLFNYLGRASAGGGGVFRRVSWGGDSDRHPTNGRAHRIELVAVVRDGTLVVDWHFSNLHDDRETVESMAADHLDRLRRLVSHCMDDGAGNLTPSDFPAIGLGQDELDQFLDSLA